MLCKPYILACALLLYFSLKGGYNISAPFSSLPYFTLSMPADTRRRDRYNRWLEFAQAAASAVTSIADGPLNVPFLKGAADLVYKIIVAAQVHGLVVQLV